MVDVECRAELILRDADGRETSLSAVVPLLKLVAQTGSIANAASAKGLSYRHAWGLLREIEARLGGALITKSRGRGSVLSNWANRYCARSACGERLETPLQAVANDVAIELNRRLAGGVSQVRIHASHGYAVAALVRALGDQRVPVDIKYRESAEAVSALARGECELAGFHLPIGEFRSTCADIYRPFLDRNRHQLIRLTRRTQGLFLPKGNPKQISGLRDLARGDVRFVNRQPGSGTRMLLDLSLRSVGVDPDQINGYATTELTHSAIAAFVASGMADLGFGVQPAAHHFALDFIPIIDEDYFFACERARLDEAQLASVLRILRSDGFTESVAHLEGYDPAHCGLLVDVDEGLHG